MAEITREGHVLTLAGTDVVNSENRLNRAGLKAALFSDSNPAGSLAGQVDFIICFVPGAPPPSNFAGVDHSQSPRPLRGIIQMARHLDEISLETLAGVLGGGIAHEIGHYWLVPGKGKIETLAGLVDTPTSAEVWQALNQGDPYPPYPIIGRQDLHWSPFINGENTPLEAGRFSTPRATPGVGFRGLIGRYDEVTGQPKVGPSFELPGEGLVQTQFRFSTLERWLMGSFKPPLFSLFPPCLRWPSFLVLRPQWSFPFPFQAGLFVHLDSGRKWYLGFHKGPHELSAHDTESVLPNDVLPIGQDPFDPYVRVGARIIQTTSEVFLQVRLWAPRIGPLWLVRNPVEPDCGEMFSDLDQPVASADDPWSGWKTLATLPGRVHRMGLSVRNIATKPKVHVILSAKLCLYQQGTAASVPVEDLDKDFPRPGPALLNDSRLMMPYAFSGDTPALYQENATSHDAPKLTMSAPGGEFGFGGLIRLDRCVQSTWAGGLGPGKKIVGAAESVKVNKFHLLWDAESKSIRQAQPLGGAYKFLFCAASRTGETITSTVVENLDKIRRGWEAYSWGVMDRHSDTTIDG